MQSHQQIKMLQLLFASSLALAAASITDIDILRSDIPEDAYLNFIQLANKYGHKCEEFDVETDDGYILKLFHIMCNECEIPVLLMHGILSSADEFIANGKKSIALDLAEAGYDVWAGNARGNKYSRRHVKLSPTQNKNAFWNFSFHEKGARDLPAIIEFILQKTCKTKLAAIGHSQGTTDFLVLGSKEPEYNEKISVFIALAPVAYLQDIDPLLSSLIKLWPVLDALFKTLGYEEVLEDKSAAKELIQMVCSQGLVGYDVCERGIVASIVGEDQEEMDPELFKVLLGHFPQGTSRKDFAHYVQIANSGCFAEYDYGKEKNLLMYKSCSPPAYNLTKATMPTVLVVGRNDGIAGLKDVERLKNELPNVVYYHVMERKKFNHIDYVFGKDTDEYINPFLKDLLCKFAKR